MTTFTWQNFETEAKNIRASVEDADGFLTSFEEMLELEASDSDLASHDEIKTRLARAKHALAMLEEEVRRLVEITESEARDEYANHGEEQAL